MLIINNRFLSLYDYNFLPVIEKIRKRNSKICGSRIEREKVMNKDYKRNNHVVETKSRNTTVIPLSIRFLLFLFSISICYFTFC